MLSVSDVWKMMNEQRPRNERQTVSQRLNGIFLKQSTEELIGQTDFSQIRMEPELLKYKPALRPHEYWHLTREDRYLIERARKLHLIPEDDDDCRSDLIAACAITEEEWVAAAERYETLSTDDDSDYEEWIATQSISDNEYDNH